MEILKNIGRAIKLGAVVYGLYRLSFADLWSQAEIDDPLISPEEKASRVAHNSTHALLTANQELRDIQIEASAIDPTAKSRARSTAKKITELFRQLESQHLAGHK